MITVNVLVGDREILISSWYSDEGGGVLGVGRAVTSVLFLVFFRAWGGVWFSKLWRISVERLLHA